ncbi:MAG: hypothetical protein A3A43_03245 [Candidatus Liptonbacteria bacterium RIFCSPLOWO2_01_FULL_56_20]|uniref:DUF5671 domain-containing protein n=1 Tax=Candidatus Liptonbacteria bacterium RIFCSPLOWO2_01_FULL_56_20 TaxID=1798652 RepID=A0A1G2CM57_9BACT|nr:MAG: hypothetical protein A3A43_03245 [Candidatus Liptonbacteria bacterium RIFCSPLOWO2_01_FULL_56_20]
MQDQLNQPVKSSPRDVFMYLLATIALYISTGSVINLLFQYINVRFPDPLNPYYDAGNPIRWALALLIILFPVYFWVSRFLYKELALNPGKSEIKIRKWLLYFTLFLAALLIIGDLVALIFNFLEGELTARFFLKVAAVLVVAAAVFWYYFYDLRKTPGTFTTKAKIFVQAVIAVLAAIVVAGVFIAGSPFKQRLVRFDRQKVNDLQSVQSQILNYWMQKERMPATLGDLTDSISGFAPPLDPQTGASYEYRVTGALAFELCATFNLPSEAGRVGEYARPMVPEAVKGLGENWDHGEGRACFTRTIDPELYRPYSKTTPR